MRTEIELIKMNWNFPLTEQKALITGGAGTIGIMISCVLALKGARILIVDKDKEKLRQASKYIGCNSGGFVSTIVCDLSDSYQTENLFDKCEKEYGSIDILVNNAGVADTNNNTLIGNVTESQLDRVMDINFKAAFLLCKSAVKSMVKRDYGRIINISSIAAFKGLPGHANYSSSKGALISMTETISLEYAKHNITANCVAPGAIDTNMTNLLPKETIKHFEEIVPVGYMGRGEDVANAVAFLATKESRYITGQTIHVDGGLYRNW